MDVIDLINNLPGVFIYFVPGYISLCIKKHYNCEKDNKEKHIIIMSVVISFIMKIIVDSFMNVLNYTCEKNYKLTEENEILVLVIISIVFTLLEEKWLYKIIIKRIDNWLERNFEDYATVWNYAMFCDHGAWAKVSFYNENVAYEGWLDKYTIDPNAEEREIILRNYTKYRINPFETIFKSDDNNYYVLINCKDAECIEIKEDKC